jgi:hypothetical protein
MYRKLMFLTLLVFLPADIATQPPDGVVDWQDLTALANTWLAEQLWPPEE